MKLLKALGFIILVFLLLFCIFIFSPDPKMETVASVDPILYMGQWYSVKEIPIFYGFWVFGFDSTECVDSQAYYELLENGNIKIRNSCIYNGEEKVVEGEGGFESSSPDGRLWVSFFPLFKSPYYIIGLDEDYQWSVVGTPDRKSLWFLSRNTTLSQEDTDEMLSVAQNQGFDTSLLKDVKR